MTQCAKKTLAGVALAVVLSLSRPAGAVAFAVADTSWEGGSELLTLARSELGHERVVVSGTLDWEQVQAGDAVLCIHPLQAIDAEEATAFIKAGGRLAIIDDYGKGDRLLTHFRIRRRSLPAFPAQFLRGKAEVAIATPALDVANGAVLGLHPTVADVRTVVLNHGTGLSHPDLTPVLEVRGSRNGSGSVDQVVTVAVAGRIDEGRLFAMGDPSAFINLMLRYPGNRSFLKGVLHYLANGDATQPRRGRLFVLVNDFGERGSYGGATPFRKSLDRKLRSLADALVKLRDEGFPWWLHLGVGALCALGVMWWALRASLKIYVARLPRFARETPFVAQGGAAGRVAVLSSPASPPALGLLEIRAALVESLAMMLGKSEHTPAGELLEELFARGDIDDALKQRAVRMLGLMRAAETLMTGGGSSARISRAQVVDAADVAKRLLAQKRP